MKKEVRIVLYILVILIFGYIGYSTWLYYQSGAEEHGLEVEGKIALHWDPYLYIYLCGEEYKLPLESGSQEIHVHKKHNMLHLGEGGTVENPEEYFTLQRAWESFKLNYTDTCLMGYCNENDVCGDGKDNAWHVTVDGQSTDTMWKLSLHDGDEIVMKYE